MEPQPQEIKLPNGHIMRIAPTTPSTPETFTPIGSNGVQSEEAAEVLTAPPAPPPTATVSPNPLTPTSQALTVPPRRPYFVTNYTKRLLEAIDHLRLQGRNINVALKGPTGCGKSELPTQYAASRQLPLATIEVGTLTDPNQLFGDRTLEAGSVRFIKSLFLEAITTPGCVVHLQELNRAENDKALNAIFSILDDSFRRVWVDVLEQYVTVAPGVSFFASFNEGFEFIGTMPLDEALANRFHITINLDYLPEKMEISLLMNRCQMSQKMAETLVSLVSSLRDNGQTPVTISTRDLINCGELIAVGLSLTDAVRATFGRDLQILESILLTLHLTGEDADANESSLMTLL